MNDTDLRILERLQANARSTNRSLAEAVGLAPSTTLQRVRDLEGRGVITGYHADVDLRALGRNLEALVFVRLQPKTGQAVDAFLDHVDAMPEAIAVHVIGGAEDAIVHLAVSDTTALRQVVLDRISNFPGVVDERTTLLFEHRRKQVIGPLPVSP